MSLLDVPSGAGDGPFDEIEVPDPSPSPDTAAPSGSRSRWRTPVDVIVVASCALFVFWQLHPDLILAETTPAGGDMGAHVWAFAYLRDHLLTDLRVSGWTPDWYAGFPVFQFYMVVPFLAMVVLNTGLVGPAAVVSAAGSALLSARAAGASMRDRTVQAAVAITALVAMTLGIWHRFNPSWRFGLVVATTSLGVLALTRGRGSARRRYASAAIVVGLAGIALPYGPSFKVVTVAGVVAMPAASYVFGRLARLPHPAPPILAVATVAFLFDKNFTIYGGNIASTMAGEFAFSISLALAIVYLGVLVHGLRTGSHRGTAAVLLALVGLCHLIPAFFALAATGVLLVLHVLAEFRAPRNVAAGSVVPLFAGAAVVGAGTVASALGLFEIGTILVWCLAGLVVVAIVGWTRVGVDDEPAADPATDPASPGVDPAVDPSVDPATDPAVDPVADPAGPAHLGRLGWLLSVGVVAALLAAWWVLPFFARRTYLNDMGWEKVAVHRPGTSVWSWFLGDIWSALVPGDLRLFAALALVGAVLSVTFRSRVGTALVVVGIALAMAFVYLPQGRLWNARLLPFWYLVVYFLAAIGVAEMVRSGTELIGRPAHRHRGRIVAAPILFVVLALFLGGQLRNVPGGANNPDGTYRVLKSVGVPGLFSVDVPEALAIDVAGRNFVTDWSRWNYSGYERKDAYPEYRGIVATMDRIGETNGCGRSLWEYSSDLNSYGTPMALMLLPHWTDGCIGSMEGLYFEASSTTPFHFLLQSELSAAPSRAQRDLPYSELDVDAGVAHMQLLGVRYYLARSAEANTAARGHADLTEIAADGPWVVYEVADADLVEPLAYEPVVSVVGEHQAEWLGCLEGHEPCPGAALEWFQDPTRWDVALAATGPAEWQRVEIGQRPVGRPVTPALVSDVVVGDDSISFSVDQTGSPVLVKMSYFPNWEVSGATGPYRVAPNLMLVVPTDTSVTLTFGRTGVDWVALAATLAGLVALVALARRGRIRVVALRDAPGTVEPV